MMTDGIIDISIRINDEIVTERVFRINSMITEEEFEASGHGSVDMHVKTMCEDILRQYNEYEEYFDD